MQREILTAIVAVTAAASTTIAADTWKPAAGPLMTRWAKDVKHGKVLPEYPRPQFAREEWRNLNGLWDYAITPRDAGTPSEWQGHILVPFPIQSALSGVMTNMTEDQRLWYRRSFEVPRGWRDKLVKLNFGASDWETKVWVNGKEVGTHSGGYDRFTFDITEALDTRGVNEIVVSVWDPTDSGPQPRGKQVRKPGGIWYTPSSGIWQTVWIEPVAKSHFESIKITPNIDYGILEISYKTVSTEPVTVTLQAKDGFRTVAELKQAAGADGGKAVLRLPNAKLWSPETPFLYDLRLTLQAGGKAVDKVESYFGMRKISMARDDKGRLRMLLNNKQYFQLGPLDQGFWPDGLYTAPTDEALRYDIEMTKKLGFNMARKHVKLEPERWYYWCDKLGLLVWQDMPSGDKSAEWKGPSAWTANKWSALPFQRQCTSGS